MKHLQKSIIMVCLLLMTGTTALAQGWPEKYSGVMLQGFYWDSYDDSKWTVLEAQADELAQTFSLIWIPQSGNCGGTSMGYDDLYWFPGHYDSSFGTENELRSMIKTFKNKGLGTIADVVINHRRNVSNWVDFPKETYNGTTYQLLSTDIVANDDGGDTKKWADANGYSLSSNNDTGEGWDGMRDLDHKSENVQANVKAYLKMLLEDMGYTGFRYDMVKGYAPEYTKLYNTTAHPTFSVGECWDGSNTIKNWIDGTKDGDTPTSAAFDFQFRYTVRNAANNGDWSYLSKQNDGNWPLISNSFNSGSYRQYAVTFVENHDTERRSNAEQDPLKKDTLAANAFLLAMPGTPCVFLKHWMSYKQGIKAMVEARKLAGITNTSTYSTMRTATTYFANLIKTDNENRLLVIVGSNTGGYEPSATQWQEILSGYHYKYFLPRKAETAWADKASGTYGSAFDVRLIAVSENSDAKIVYTLDGSEPTASSTAVVSGTVISFKEEGDYTLKAALLVNGTVKTILTRNYTIKIEKQDEFSIPAFCSRAENEVCAFFEAPATWTGTVYCWAWTSNDNFTYADRKWPGVACKQVGTTDGGKKVWKWTWDGTKQNNTSATQPAQIIFSNDGSPQTSDMTFSNGGYYDLDHQLRGTVAITSGIEEISSDIQGRNAVYDLQGRRIDASSLRKGIYIVNGRKVIIK